MLQGLSGHEHAESSIRDAASEFGDVRGNWLGETIDVNVVVAGAVHLGEVHGK